MPRSTCKWISEVRSADRGVLTVLGPAAGCGAGAGAGAAQNPRPHVKSCPESLSKAHAASSHEPEVHEREAHGKGLEEERAESVRFETPERACIVLSHITQQAVRTSEEEGTEDMKALVK